METSALGNPGESESLFGSFVQVFYQEELVDLAFSRRAAFAVIDEHLLALSCLVTHRRTHPLLSLRQLLTQNVRCWRTVIFFLLLITGAFVSSYTYLFLKQEQNSDFESNVRTISCYNGRILYYSFNMAAFVSRWNRLSFVCSFPLQWRSFALPL